MKIYLAIIYASCVIFTGLLRSIEAQSYKPNALWFCMVMGLLIIMAAYLSRLGKSFAGNLLLAMFTCIVFSFYLQQFITNPASNANLRIGFIICASITFAACYFLPRNAREAT